MTESLTDVDVINFSAVELSSPPSFHRASVGLAEASQPTIIDSLEAPSSSRDTGEEGTEG